MGRDLTPGRQVELPCELAAWTAPFITVSMVVDAGLSASLGPATTKVES